ncbi:MAG: serine protease [Burkholderiales bacterium]|jgi:S1-C subfamily serine protease|nr:serine protease [Burkholderiales bacterium]
MIMPLLPILLTMAGLLVASIPLAAQDFPPDDYHGSSAAVFPTAEPPRALSATAEQIFSRAQPRLLQIRTLLKTAQKQSSIGSGFLVNADGLAITNYHVVSQYALEPNTYQLEYVAADGSKGKLFLYAIDVINDLAVVRPDVPEGTRFQFFEFNPAAVKGILPKGERLFAMGNPLDLGFTIVEGIYNGLVEKSYQTRVHFTGALNPGMSGGPTVTSDNRIAGVNVAKMIRGDLVSFLVPADAAYALLGKVQNSDEMDAANVRKEISEQLAAWQNEFFAKLKEQGFRKAVFGPYTAAESNADWFNCWATTNSDERPKPRALINRSSCDTGMHLFLANDMSAGNTQLSHTYLKAQDLNAMQFSEVLTRHAQLYLPWRAQNRYTPFRCYENFLASNVETPHRPVLRVTWCARAYRDIPEIYDVSVLAVTQDNNKEALVSNLSLHGVGFDNALMFTGEFLSTLEVNHDLD